MRKSEPIIRYCLLCEKPADGNINPEHEVICWECVYKLTFTSQEKLRECHSVLLDKGFIEKAETISKFITEKAGINESRKTESNLERSRLSKTNGTSYKAQRQL